MVDKDKEIEQQYQELLTEALEGKVEDVIDKMNQGMSAQDIATELKTKVGIVKKFIDMYSRAEQGENAIMTTPDISLSKEKLKKEIDIVDNLHFIMSKLKNIVSQLEDTDPDTGDQKVMFSALKPYLEALKNFTGVTQWMADRRIKIEEIMRNEVITQAIFEELKAESPEFQKRVLARIENIKQKNNIFL